MEGDIRGLINQTIVTILTEFQHFAIVVEVAIPSHLVHHKVLLVFQLAEDHGEQRKQFWEAIYVDIVREVPIEDLVIGAIQIVTLEHIDDLEHENAACLGVNALLLHLVARDVGEELLLRLQISPDLVQYLVRAEEIIDTDLECKQFFALLFNIVTFVEDND